MTPKKILTPVFAVAGVAAAVALLAGFGPMRRGHMDPAHMQRMVQHHVDDTLDDLDASQQQRQAIQPLVDATFKDMTVFHQDNAKARAQLVEAMGEDNPDRKALHGQVDQRVDAFRALAHRMLDRTLEAHDVLDAKQRAALMDELGHMHNP